MYGFLKVSNQVALFYIKDCIPSPRGVVVMCHGFTNHAGDYERYVQRLNDAGYSVYRYDMRGHGKTKSVLGDIDNIQTYVKDLHTIVRIARRENAHVSLFTLGFSMGGLVSALFGVQYPGSLSGQLFLGPAVGFVASVPDKTRKLVNVAYRVAPHTLVKFDGDGIALNAAKNKETLEAVYHHTSRNPLRLEYFTVRFIKVVFIDGAQKMLDSMHRYFYPCFIAQGDLDATVPKAISEHFYNAIPAKDKSLKIYPDMHHVLYDEPNGLEVMDDSIAWLDERCAV